MIKRIVTTSFGYIVVLKVMNVLIQAVILQMHGPTVNPPSPRTIYRNKRPQCTLNCPKTLKLILTGSRKTVNGNLKFCRWFQRYQLLHDRTIARAHSTKRSLSPLSYVYTKLPQIINGPTFAQTDFEGSHPVSLTLHAISPELENFTIWNEDLEKRKLKEW